MNPPTSTTPPEGAACRQRDRASSNVADVGSRTTETPTRQRRAYCVVASARVRPGELVEIEAAAARAGVSRSAWSRAVLVMAARQSVR